MENLKNHEIEQVSGAAIFNIIGGLAGAAGGFYGALIAGGQNASGWDLAAGTLGGLAVGFINPVRGIGGAVSSAGGGIIAGSITNLMDDVKFVSNNNN